MTFNDIVDEVLDDIYRAGVYSNMAKQKTRTLGTILCSKL